MTAAIARMELRLRARIVLSAGLGLVGVAVLVGALFPSLGGSIGDLDLPKGVNDLLGGGQFSTLTGWLRTEIASVYGPLVFAGVAIASAVATSAGEEEGRILGLVLAHPVPRSRLLLAKAAAVAAELALLGLATFGGLLLAVLAAGGGIATGNLAAMSLQLVFFGLAAGALALAVAASTGRRGVAAGVAAGVFVLMFLVNGFAPLNEGTSWLQYLTAFHYLSGGDPLAKGVDLGGLGVLAAASALLTAIAIAGFARRDLRG